MLRSSTQVTLRMYGPQEGQSRILVRVGDASRSAEYSSKR